jgi:1,2-diacylglycerol 3-beta-glucosyltransferase
MRYRLVLVGLTILALSCLKVIDSVLPWPGLCVLLTLTIVLVFFHSLWFLHAQRSDRRKLKSSMESKWLPSVDILIPAKNESRVIERTVKQFMELDYPDFRVWVIDDASDDNMPSILKKLKQELPNFDYISRPKGSYPGKSAGLNDALPHCRSEVIAVFDADACVAPDFLNRILPALEPERVGAVQAQKKIYEHQKKFFLPSCQSSEYALDTYFQVGRDLIGGAVELRGNGQLIKRDALIDVGGWNNRAITDDLDLTMRLLLSKWSIRFSDDTHVYEEAVTTWKGLFRQRRRWAEGSIRRYLDYIFPLNSPSSLSLVKRLDILAFLSEFAIPGLMLLELVCESVNFLSGEPVHPKFLLTLSAVCLSISMTNIFVAIRTYRKELSIWEAMIHNLEVNFYMYGHWVPCVMISFWRIAMSSQASTWHRTEHLGEKLESA